MINISPNLQSLLHEHHVELIYLVEISPKIRTDGYTNVSKTIYTTSHYQDFELLHAGIPQKTFESDGRLVKLDDWQIDEVIDSSSFVFYFADPYFNDLGGIGEWEDEANKQYSYDFMSKDVEVRAAFVNPFDTVLGDANPGEPLREITDTILVYKGIVNDVTSTTTTNEQGEVIIKVTCSSPMAN